MREFTMKFKRLSGGRSRETIPHSCPNGVLGVALTHIDCQFFRGQNVRADSSSFAAINPTRKPGSLLLAGACAARENIGGQVACRMAMEQFVEGVLEFFDQPKLSGEGGAGTENEISLDVLEAAFKRANNAVYQFGHKLAAGGKMATSLIGLVIEENIIASGRAGDGCAYLHRAGQLFPFFEAPKSSTEGLGRYLGAHALVSVELASVPVEAGDVILVFPAKLQSAEESALLDCVQVHMNLSARRFENLLSEVFQDINQLPFALTAHVGPDAIYLSPLAGVS